MKAKGNFLARNTGKKNLKKWVKKLSIYKMEENSKRNINFSI